MPISDKQFEDIERLLNLAIHELVFAAHHADDDQSEEAQDNLMTASGNINEAWAILTGERPAVAQAAPVANKGHAIKAALRATKAALLATKAAR